ncbi:MAG: hypothetical protein SCALA702_09270 [Melioribacteraceae bacterium]|nr:MAG: hypothetical protein SCALA702_09270 [Melioribacteraceae bacterium]
MGIVSVQRIKESRMIRVLFQRNRNDSRGFEFINSIEGVQIIEANDSLQTINANIIICEYSFNNRDKILRFTGGYGKYLPVIILYDSPEEYKYIGYNYGSLFSNMEPSEAALLIKNAINHFKDSRNNKRVEILGDLFSLLRQKIVERNEPENIAHLLCSQFIETGFYEYVNIKLLSAAGDEYYSEVFVDNSVPENSLQELVTDNSSIQKPIIIEYSGKKLGKLVTAVPGIYDAGKAEKVLLKDLLNIFGKYIFKRNYRLQNLESEQILRVNKTLTDSQRIGKLGNWDLFLKSGEIVASEEAYNVLDLPDSSEFFLDDFREILISNEHPKFEGLLAKILQYKIPVEDNFRIITPAGKSKHVKVKAEYITDNGSSRLSGIIQDVTDYFKAREALVRSEEKFRTFFEMGLIGMCILDENLDWINVNSHLCNMLGFTKDELRRTNWLNLTHPKYSQDELSALTKICKGELDTFSGNKQFITKGNKSIDAYVSIKAVSGISGEEKQLLCLVEDITIDLANEKALEEYRDELQEMVRTRTIQASESEERFRTLAEHSEDSIMRFNTKLEHLYVNKIVEKHTGIPARDFIGKTHVQLNFEGEILELVEGSLKKTIETGKKNRIEFVLPNGIWIDWLIIPEFDTNKNVIGLLAYGRDITERKGIEESLRRALAHEKNVGELRTRFISTTSHEFRTPLTAVMSSAELLEMGYDRMSPEKRTASFGKIYSSVEYMISLLDDLLLINHSESGRLEFRPQLLDINSICSEVISDVKLIANETHKFSLNGDSEKLIKRVDGKIIRQILSNLLTNAVKYSPRGGRIELELTAQYDKLLLKVSDEGVGISDDDLFKVFEPFYRGQNVSNIKGTGLGLPIVKKLVDLHGGELHVKSEINSGSTFTVELPMNT